MEKVNRTPEFIISLISAIWETIAWLPVVAIILLITIGNVPNEGSPFGFTMFLFITTIRIPVTILNWIGTFKLKKRPEGWGIYFLVSGIVSISILNIVVGGMLLGRHPKSLTGALSK